MLDSVNHTWDNAVEKSGLTHDQAKYVVVLISAFWLGHLFRIFLNPKSVSPTIRHFVSLIFGAAILSLCFGKQAGHLLISSILAFVLMESMDEKVVHLYVMVVAMLYLSFVHIWRMLLQSDTYVIDISAPLMLATIKITYVGYGIHDSSLPTDENHKNTVELRKRPTLLEFLSYVFNFSTVLAGPPPEYQDYIDFIEGTQFDEYKSQLKDKEPSPLVPSVKKIVIGYFLVALYTVFVPYFSPEFLGDGVTLQGASLLYRILFAEMVIYLMKFKYGSAFLIGEGVCNAAGIGFNGVDEKGGVKWDKITAMYPIEFEYARNIRECVDCWNVTTNLWFKKCVYSRVEFLHVLATFTFSALWHGFYFGYYMFFIPLAIASAITKKIRRKVRPYFLQSPKLKLFYDVITWTVTRMVISFYAAGFTMLNTTATLRFWRESSFYGHYLLLFGIIIVLVLPDVINKEVFPAVVNGNGQAYRNEDVHHACQNGSNGFAHEKSNGYITKT